MHFFHFWIRNWSDIAIHLVSCCSCLSYRFQKCLRLCHFKLHQDEIWQESSSSKYTSIDRVRLWIWRHSFKIGPWCHFTQKSAATWWVKKKHLVTPDYAAVLLIYTTFVLVFFSKCHPPTMATSALFETLQTSRCIQFETSECSDIHYADVTAHLHIWPCSLPWTPGLETHLTMTGTVLLKGQGLPGWARLCGTHCCRCMGCCCWAANLEGTTTYSRLCAAVSEWCGKVGPIHGAITESPISCIFQPQYIPHIAYPSCIFWHILYAHIHTYNKQTTETIIFRSLSNSINAECKTDGN